MTNRQWDDALARKLYASGEGNRMKEDHYDTAPDSVRRFYRRMARVTRLELEAGTLPAVPARAQQAVLL